MPSGISQSVAKPEGCNHAANSSGGGGVVAIILLIGSLHDHTEAFLLLLGLVWQIVLVVFAA